MKGPIDLMDEDKKPDDKRDSGARYDPIAALASVIGNHLWREGHFRNCINCDYWRSSSQTCGLFNAFPPGEVIVKGCEKHTDAIPF